MRPQVKLRFLLVWLVVFISLPALAASQVLAPSQSEDFEPLDIPKEPGWNHPSYRGWESLSVPGLIATYYDLDLDHELDYMVIRKVIRKASAEETTIEKAIEIAKFDDLSVFFSHPVVYFTNRNPLFYCIGVDHRRNCRDMWVDIAEDGLNGNEQLYTLSTPSLGVR
jgi:hypothetical protein